MYESKPLSEIAPVCRLLHDEPPPVGKRIWMITKYGNGFVGQYHPEYGVLAWCPLPALTKAQKIRLKELTDATRNDQVQDMWRASQSGPLPGDDFLCVSPDYESLSSNDGER